MIATEKYGAYHAADEGACSWSEFARNIFSKMGKRTKLELVPADKYPVWTTRSLNLRLSKDKLEKMGYSRLPAWQNALERYLKSL